MLALPHSVGRRRRAGDPVNGAAGLGAHLVEADVARAGGLHREPEFLLKRAGDGAADRVVLPACIKSATLIVTNDLDGSVYA
jgi:hypothetical protein